MGRQCQLSMVHARPHVLVVEDDGLLNQHYTRELRRHGFRVTQATNLAAATHVLDGEPAVDILLLDRCLPDGDGLELLPELCFSNPHTRVCVLSARNTLSERVFGLNEGADAYFAKPAALTEVASQLRALMRRGRTSHQQFQWFHDLLLEKEEQWLRRAGHVVRLTRRETDILIQLMNGTNGLASQEQLLRTFLLGGRSVCRSAVHATIGRLRTKLEPLGIHIHTIYGLGYRLVAR